MKEMQAESDYSGLEFSEIRAVDKLFEYIGFGFVAVAERDGEIIGGMIGDTYMPLFSEDLIGTDFGLFIKPGNRGGTVAASLIRSFEAWCKKVGAKQLRPGVSTGDGMAGKLYASLGYKPVGEQFFKQV
jgi:GNAT superfamily N-acetyltransferase